MEHKYEIIIYWNTIDNVFVAEMPELKGCMAHGETQDEALKEIGIVANEWISLARQNGWTIPEPKGKLTFA